MTLTGTTLEVSLENDGVANETVDLGSINTDDQTIDQFDISSNTLNLSLESDGAAPLTVDLSPYLDNTDAQDLTLTGNTLAISGDPNTDVDLTGYLDNTDDQNASQVPYSNGGSGLTALSVQAAIDEIDGIIDAGDLTDDQNAMQVSFSAGGNIAAGNVQAAIAELDTEKQATDPALSSIAGLTTDANEMIYTTAADTYTSTSITSAGRAILDDADDVAQRATLGLVIGTHVQEQSAALNIYSGIAPSTDVQAALGVSTDADLRTEIGLGSLATQESSNVTLTGGNIDGTTIGGTTPAAATVTTLRVSTLTTNGAVSTINSDGTFTVSSDSRLKENIELLQNTLSKLDQLGGYNYNYKADKNKQKQIGVIAQELEKVFPELVKVDERGFKMVNYQGLIPVLMQAIKEQQLEIGRLSEKLANQESKLSELSSDNQEMKKDLDLIKEMLMGTESAKKED